MNPDGFTLRELDLMCKARLKADWNRTSVLCCVISNLLKTKKDKMSKPSDFNPYAEKEKPMEMSMADFQKMMFGNRKSI